jgi:thioredoxin 1
MAIEVTDAMFEQTVLKSDKPVLVDFWAAWCGPCRMLHPIVDELNAELGDKVVFAKVDVDNNQEYAAKYGVRNIPTVLLFKGGEIVDKQVGVAPKNVYLTKLNALL